MKFLFYDFPTRVRARDYVGLDVETPLLKPGIHPYAPHLDAKTGQKTPPQRLFADQKN